MSRNLSENSAEKGIARNSFASRQLERRPEGPGRFQIKVFPDDTANSTGNGKFIMFVPSDLDEARLFQVEMGVTTVSSSGKPTVQIRNITQSNVDMLSTRVTVDVSEFYSETASVAVVIDAANAQVFTGDRIAVDVDVAGTGAKGLTVILGYV